jgi:hypothetical protein
MVFTYSKIGENFDLLSIGSDYGSEGRIPFARINNDGQEGEDP